MNNSKLLAALLTGTMALSAGNAIAENYNSDDQYSSTTATSVEQETYVTTDRPMTDEDTYVVREGQTETTVTRYTEEESYKVKVEKNLSELEYGAPNQWTAASADAPTFSGQVKAIHGRDLMVWGDGGIASINTSQFPYDPSGKKVSPSIEIGDMVTFSGAENGNGFEPMQIVSVKKPWKSSGEIQTITVKDGKTTTAKGNTN